MAIGHIWLPRPLHAFIVGPLAVGVITACWVLRPRSAERPAGACRLDTPTGVIIAGILVTAWIMPVGHAAAPASVTVYLVPTSVNAPALILAPSELLDRLRDLNRRGHESLATSAWLEARYDGKVTSNHLEFTATYRIHAFSDDPPPLLLPLTGVQLSDVKLDGAHAFPRAVDDRYSIGIRGRGPHTLEVTFTAPLDSPEGIGPGTDREVRLGIPEIVTSHLTLLLPQGATRVQALSWLGAQQLEADGGRPKLDVDLGRVKTIHVRWQTEGPSRAPVVRSRETYLWDLSESCATPSRRCTLRDWSRLDQQPIHRHSERSGSH